MDKIWNLDIESFEYFLPPNLIAQEPCLPADECKLLLCCLEEQKIDLNELKFKNIVDLIDNHVFFVNQTKVLRARLKIDESMRIEYLWNKKKIKWEIFYLKTIWDRCFETLIFPGKKFNIWTKIYFDDWTTFEIVEKTNDWRIIKSNKTDFLNFFEKNWQIPLPPYIWYKKSKEKFYQSKFAKTWDSVASPTASLHFTKNLIDSIKKKWIKFEKINLNIGLWTFKSIDTKNIKDYNIHKEKIILNKNIFKKIYEYKKNNIKIISVWTTVIRSLESLPYLWTILNDWKKLKFNDINIIRFWNNLSKNCNKNNKINEIISDIKIDKYNIEFSTKLFIYQWFKFKVLDEIITNFHLPKSSLLVLISAFMWYENFKKSYEYAIKNWFKFYSFWDAMYIRRV